MEKWINITIFVFVIVLPILALLVKFLTSRQSRPRADKNENMTEEVRQSTELEPKASSGLSTSTIAVIVVLVVVILGLWLGARAMLDREVMEKFVAAVNHGNKAAWYVQGYYVKNRMWPDQNDLANNVTDAPQSVREVKIDSSGRIALTMQGADEIDGKIIQYNPERRESSLSWVCESDYRGKKFPQFLENHCNRKPY
jgi:hypothetical protein